MPDISLLFNPPAAWDQLPAEVIARIDRLTEDLAELGPHWILHVLWHDHQHGTNQIVARPATTQTGAAA